MPTVLVVEDDTGVRETIADTFKANGFRVIEASDGLEALKVLSVLRVDVITTDQGMPHLTGTQLLSEIQKQGMDIPVILFCSQNDEFMERCRTQGFAAVCKKMRITMQELVEVAKLHLAAHAQP